jgi:hypothetical protein
VKQHRAEKREGRAVLHYTNWPTTCSTRRVNQTDESAITCQQVLDVFT